jgi:hypothetical protein
VSASAKKRSTPPPAPHDLEAVVETVRSLWTAAGQSDPQVQAWLQKTVVDGIERIKQQVHGRLRMAALVARPRQTTKAHDIDNKEEMLPTAPVQQRPLFEEEPTPPAAKSSAPASSPVAPAKAVPRFPECGIRVYAKELVPQARKVIPKAARFSDIASYRKHLHETLPYNAVATRKRNANYLIGRFFPGEHLHPDLVAFAAAAERHRALGDVLFYLTCRTEKMVAMVAEALIWPSLADGGLPRSRIQDFIKAHFPRSRSAKQVSSAIVRTYTGFGVATATRTRMNVAQRQGHLAALAYILYLEFPEPGMYSFDKLLDGPMHKWLLWDRKWIAEQLYMLRHFKLLSKVSDIDNMRQFTTKYSLAEAVNHILPLLKEEQP